MLDCGSILLWRHHARWFNTHNCLNSPHSYELVLKSHSYFHLSQHDTSLAFFLVECYKLKHGNMMIPVSSRRIVNIAISPPPHSLLTCAAAWLVITRPICTHYMPRFSLHRLFCVERTEIGLSPSHHIHAS